MALSGAGCIIVAAAASDVAWESEISADGTDPEVK